MATNEWDIDTVRITGVHVTYYFVCKRKLWLYSHGITMEHESQAVKLGKLLDESTFERDRKNVMIDGIINIDFLRGDSMIHEIKSSDALSEAHEWQVKYYLYYLGNKGSQVTKGVIHYPKSRQTEEIVLTPNDRHRLEHEILPAIQAILGQSTPVAIERLPFCPKCSYFGFCFT